MLASLAVFALGVGLLWRAAFDASPMERNFEMAAQLLENLVPGADAPDAQARLERLTAKLRVDAALYSSSGRRLAEVGQAPTPGDAESGWRRGDRHGAWTVRLNLLENARRHGTPPIELHLRRTRAGACIEVCDRGAPIPAADRDRLFEPFYRRAGTRDATGSGLGLSLVRQIARLHGGDACYRADETKGCFNFEVRA